MRVGISFDRPADYPESSGPADIFAEFEPESTILAMEAAIRSAGHVPVRLGAPASLLSGRPEVDVIWNIAEGMGTRNRESWLPVLAEMHKIPVLGSDALTLGISLDKFRTKIIAGYTGVPVTDTVIVPFGSTIPVFTFPYPVFVKPRYEGTAKGIGPGNKCAGPEALKTRIDELHELYRQDILIEPFLAGAEFTCALAGSPLRVLDVLERALHTPSGIGLHAVEAATGKEEPWSVTHRLPEQLDNAIRTWSLDVCKALDVKHWARLDFKLDSNGNPFFLEINPLPTFGTDQTFAILAEIKGQAYADFLAGFLQECLEDALSQTHV